MEKILSNMNGQEDCPSKLGKRQQGGRPADSQQYNHRYTTKSIQNIKMGNEEVKLSQFVDMIVYLKKYQLKTTTNNKNSESVRQYEINI